MSEISSIPADSYFAKAPKASTSARITNMTMHIACILCAIAMVAMLIWITGYLLAKGFSSLTPAFFLEMPTGDLDHPGGMASAIIGSLVLVGTAALVGIPFGLLTGIYLAEYDVGSWIATPVRFVCDVLAGVPSIVVGILGYELLVRPMGHYNGWAGAAALAFIMVPIVARTAEEMFRLVPASYRQASIALGATKATTILKVVLPSAGGSVFTGIMLAIARVAGETAPLLFTALGSSLMPLIFWHKVPIGARMSEAVPSLTVQIFHYAQAPYEAQNNLAWAGVLVLILMIFVLNTIIRIMTRKKH